MANFFLSLLGILLVLIILLMAFLHFNQEKIIFFPETLPENHAFRFDYPFEEVFLEAPDGARLNALHFKAQKPKGVILYFHGNAGSLRSWGMIAGELVERDYDLFILDYRTFGKSTGALSEEAMHADARLAYDHLAKQFPEQEIVIFGRSIGSGMAVKLAAQTRPRLLILETPMYNMEALAMRHYPMLPAGLLLRYLFRSDQWIGQVKSPIYLLHGTADTIIPHEAAEQLAALATSPAEVILISGGGHNDLATYPAYKEAIDRILRGEGGQE